MNVVYEYRMVQIPVGTFPERGGHGNAAAYLQELVNFGAEQGWEFFRIDNLGTPAIGGGQVITFRRPRVVPPLPSMPVTYTEQNSPLELEESAQNEEQTEEKPWWR